MREPDFTGSMSAEALVRFIRRIVLGKKPVTLMDRDGKEAAWAGFIVVPDTRRCRKECSVTDSAGFPLVFLSVRAQSELPDRRSFRLYEPRKAVSITLVSSRKGRLEAKWDHAKEIFHYRIWRPSLKKKKQRGGTRRGSEFTRHALYD